MSGEKTSKTAEQLYRNEIYTHFDDPKPHQAYQAWRADPEKWVGWWDSLTGKLRPYDVPDYRIYKIDGIWQLELVQSTLAKKGLKDPWIRNEVWKYPPDLHYKGISKMIDVVFGKNFASLKWGLFFTAVTVIGDNLWYKYKYGGRPEWSYDMREWIKEYIHMKPNQ